MDEFRRLFLRGLAVLVPTLVTLGILVWSYGFVNDYVGHYINLGLRQVCVWISPEPAPRLIDPYSDPLEYGTPIDEWNDRGERLTAEFKVIHHSALSHHDPAVRAKAQAACSQALWKIAFVKWRLHLLGFLIAILLVYFMGFFLASFVGRTSWRMAEGLLGRIPLIRAVYPNVKQVTDFLLSERKVEFSSVVAVQYPRVGLWALGLRTGPPMERVQQAAADTLVTVFIPSSPTPFTGYVIQVPVKEIVELNMTIDEALRFTMSGGVVQPEGSLPRSTLGDSDS